MTLETSTPPAVDTIDDPEVYDVARTIAQGDGGTIDIAKWRGPKGRAGTWADIMSGKLPYFCGTKRQALTIEVARYLLRLRKEGATDEGTEARREAMTALVKQRKTKGRKRKAMVEAEATAA